MKADTTRHPSRPHPAGAKSGETIPTILGEQAPKLPHERDESGSSQHGHQDETVKQAARDIEAGRRDTDIGPPLDETYHRNFHEAPKQATAGRQGGGSK